MQTIRHKPFFQKQAYFFWNRPISKNLRQNRKIEETPILQMPGHRIRHGRSAVWQNSSDRRSPPLIMKHCRPPSCSLTAIHYRRGVALILLGKRARHNESLGGQPSFLNEVLKKGRYDIVVSRFAYTSSPLQVFHSLHRSHNSTHLRDGCQEMHRN